MSGVRVTATDILGSRKFLARETRLASVYVDPPHRDKGVGSQLVQHVMTEARQLGFAEMYLFTPDREQFYTRLGWRVHERTTFRGVDVVIMALDLTADSRDD